MKCVLTGPEWHRHRLIANDIIPAGHGQLAGNNGRHLALNILKMICYRTETTFALMPGQDYARQVNEKRALARRVINTPADILVDESNRVMHIKIYSQATPRDNAAVQQICQKLNETQTTYPGTDWVLQYDLAT